MVFHPHLAAVKPLWDAGDMAIVAGVGYPNPNRSHFRSMDIWHTCEPDEVATEGWLGKAVLDIDPHKENVLTAVNFGNGLPRAMVKPGVPVTSVSDLESYGLLNSMEGAAQRSAALDVFQKIYGQAIGSGPVNDYIRQTGLDAMKGADVIKVAPERYSSSIEYADNSIAQALRGRSAGASGRPGDASVLYAVRWVRRACERGGNAEQAVAGCVGRNLGLLRGPARATTHRRMW